MAGKNKIKKTECPVSRKEFTDGAPKVTVTIDGVSYDLAPRSFSTGSLGYNLSDKGRVVIGGKACKTQIGLNITLVGSKELPAEAAEGERKAA